MIDRLGTGREVWTYWRLGFVGVEITKREDMAEKKAATVVNPVVFFDITLGGEFGCALIVKFPILNASKHRYRSL